MKNRVKLLFLLVLFIPLSGLAGELVYYPVNPAFGGNPGNGAVLLSNAQAQDQTKSPEEKERQAQSATDRLISRLESQITSNLLKDLAPGSSESMTTDDYTIVFTSDVDGSISLTITDLTTGETTIVEASTGLYTTPVP